MGSNFHDATTTNKKEKEEEENMQESIVRSDCHSFHPVRFFPKTVTTYELVGNDFSKNDNKVTK